MDIFKKSTNNNDDDGDDGNKHENSWKNNNSNNKYENCFMDFHKIKNSEKFCDLLSEIMQI